MSDHHDEPNPVGVHLRAAAEALAAKRAEHDKRQRPHPALVDDEDMVQIRRAGIEELRRERWSAMVPNRFQWAKVDDFTDDLAADLRVWSDDPRGRNLLLFGPVGTGKTHAAIAACRQAADKGLSVRFLPVVELLDLLRPGGPEGALHDLGLVDRLIIDDLGTERPTEWTAERLGALINRRWLEALPTVATTNLAPKELEEFVGARTYSRLVDDAVAVHLGGADRRRQRRG